MPLRIEDYALIGDCLSGALVGRDGSGAFFGKGTVGGVGGVHG